MIFLAGRERYTQRTLYREVHHRLSKQPGCANVRYWPSRRRPRYVVADVETLTFLDTSYEVETARLEVRYWYPEGVDYEYYRLNWVEPTRDLMVGFHRDAGHAELGPCHVQLDYDENPVDRQPADVLDVHPLAVLDERLQQLPTVLDAVRWQDGQPSLPTVSV